jgi:hypothetical protein
MAVLTFSAVMALGCHNTWQGVKTDTHRAVQKTGNGVEKTGEKIEGEGKKKAEPTHNAAP